MKYKWKLWGITALAVLALVSIPMAATAADLEMDDQNDVVGGQVTFTISVNNAPNPASNFQFRVYFDGTVLDFVEGSEGPLVEDFEMFDISQTGANFILVETDLAEVGIIGPGASGHLATLTFNVISEPALGFWPLVLFGLSGDFAPLQGDPPAPVPWETRNGRFTYFGITPPSATVSLGGIPRDFNVEAGLLVAPQPPYTWALDGDVVLGEDFAGVYTFQATEEGVFTLSVEESGVTENPLTDTALINVVEGLVIPQKPAGYKDDDPATWPVVEFGEDLLLTVESGTTPYAWEVEFRGATVATGGEPEFPFAPLAGGPFAGAYKITVTDSSVEQLSATMNVKTPMEFTFSSKNILEGGSFGFALRGAVTGALTDEIPVDITPPGEAPATFDVGNFGAGGLAPGSVSADVPVDELTKFRVQVTVSGDDELTELNGLSVATTGWIRVLPLATYSGVVTESGVTTTIPGARIIFKQGEDIKASTNSLADGFFVVNLPAPETTGAAYDVVVLTAGPPLPFDPYLPFTRTTEGWESGVSETIPLTPATDWIVGWVEDIDTTQRLADAKVAATVEDEPFVAYSSPIFNGFYWLNVDVDLTGVTTFASAGKLGYATTEKQDVINDTPNFSLDPLAPVGDVWTIPVFGGAFVVGGVTVDIPGDVLAESGVTETVDVTVVPDLGVGVETIYTQHSTNLVEITVVPPLIGKIVVTMPFDTTDVDPGDFRAGKAVIYYAPTADDLQNGNKGAIKAVPVSDLVYEDHLNGLVSFRVIPASVFSAGAALAPTPPTPPTPPLVGDDDSGCFINTITLW